jgi:REP-associated tyrosine transposase
VYTRGSNRLPIFFDNADYADFRELLAKIVARDRWRLFAYCLMPNHFHLLLEVGAAGLSRGMQTLNGGFSRRTSVKYGRVAHLFKNRFGHKPVETTEQFLWTGRYIVLNPVAAGICAEARQWRWSSYRACAGYERPPTWLDVDGFFERAGFDGVDPRAAYRRYVEEGPIPVSDTAADLQQLVHSRP